MTKNIILKHPKNELEFCDDIADFCVMQGLLRLISDRLYFWKQERAVNKFKSNCNSTINHVDGLNQILDYYFKVMIPDKDKDQFDEIKETVYNTMLDYFTKVNIHISDNLKEKIDLTL